jgi:hypothetical protein
MTEPTFAETRRLFVRLVRIKLGRLAFRASWAFAAVAERLLEPELRRIDQ